MKNIKNVLIIMLLAVSVVSCSDEFLDVNSSSTNPPTSTPALSLPAAQKMTADMYFNANNAGNSFNLIGGIHAGVISDSGDHVWYDTEQQYFIINDTYQSLWNNSYSLPLATYNFVENFEGDVYDNYKAIAKIMKAFLFATLVDQYGDIPYSEAFGRGDNTRPAYDDDKSIYDALYADLNLAIDMISNAPAGTLAVNEDAMLGGNMAAWQRFANTLKLRMLLRQVNTGENFSAQYSEIENNGIGFVNSTVSVNPGYADQANQQNPYYALFGFGPGGGAAARNHDATRGNHYYVEFLKDNNDPRVSRLFELASNGDYVGVPQNVYVSSLGTPLTSDLGPALLAGSTQDAQLMLESESIFLQAEAVQRGFISGDAGSLYKAGIEANFGELGVPSAATAAAAYELNSNNKINWDLAVANGNEIEAIITQKWVGGGFISGFEVWMDRVRTNFPADVPIPVGAFSPVFPSNLLYPSAELATNAANVPSQGTNAAFDRHTFWAQ